MIEKAWALGYTIPEIGERSNHFPLPDGGVTLTKGAVIPQYHPLLDSLVVKINDVKKAAAGLNV